MKNQTKVTNAKAELVSGESMALALFDPQLTNVKTKQDQTEVTNAKTELGKIE